MPRVTPKLPFAIWALLTARERWKVIGLMALVSLMGVAQVVGVGSVAPFVSVLVSPDSVKTNPWLQTAYHTLGFASTNEFLLFLAAVVLASLVLANVLLTATQFLLFRFSSSLQYRLSRQLLSSYLYQPYAAFLGQNTADIGKNVLSEVGLLTDGVVIPFLRIFALSVASLLLVGALLWANPILTTGVVTALGGGYVLVFLAVRKTLTLSGKARVDADTERYKAVAEAFGGIKVAKVLGREAGLLSRFDGPARTFAKVQATYGILTQIPRYTLEILGVGAVLLLALVLLGTGGGNINGIAPLLALYAYAAQRLLPFLNQIYQSVGELRFNRVIVETVFRDMASKQVGTLSPASSRPPQQRITFHNEIRLDHVTFAYPHSARPALQDFCLSIRSRSFVALVGATGAGKSTVADVVLGLLVPSRGSLLVDGTAIDHSNVRAWQNILGYVPQEIYLADDTIAANIAYGIPARSRDDEAIIRAATVANLHEFIDTELPLRYGTVVGDRGVRLSGGQRQRIGIARALYHDPEVLILDEATSSLDQGTESAVYRAIEQVASAKTVIMIAHRLAATVRCETLFHIQDGQVVESGTYDALLKTSPRFRSLAGVD